MANKPVYVSPEGQTNPGQTPWWQDPLNRAMGMLPEGLARGALAADEAFDVGFNPSQTAPDYYEKYFTSKLPQELQDLGGFMGDYAALSGVSPESAIPGQALMSPALLGKAKIGGGFEKISPAAKAYIKESTKTLGKKFPKGDPTGEKYREALVTSLRRKLRVEMDPDLTGFTAGTYDPRTHRIRFNPEEMQRGEAITSSTVASGAQRVSDRELMHSVWEFIPEDSRRVITKAVKQGDFPTHPDLQKYTYRGATEQQTANESFSHYLADWAASVPARTEADKKMYRILDDLLPAKDPLLKAMGQ